MQREIDILNEYSKIIEIIRSSNQHTNTKEGQFFNIFTAISDQYKKENLHSDLLHMILNPNSQEGIKNVQFLKIFLQNFYTDTEIINLFPYIENTNVVREKGRIDILIYNDRTGIIIENKINDAVDQNNQLARYFELLTADKDQEGKDLNIARQNKFHLKNKLSNVKIIYIAKNAYKKPDFKNYSDYYQKFISQMKVEYFPLRDDNSEKDLLHYFENILNLDLKTDQKVFIRHYYELLQFIGDSEMYNESEKDLIKNIFSNKQQIITNQLTNTWTARGNIIAELLYEKLNDKDGIKKSNIPGLGGPWLFWGNDIGVYLCGVGNELQMGFYNTGRFDQKEDYDKYSAYIRQLNTKISIPEKIDWQYHWIFFNFGIDHLSLDEIENCVKDIFEQLSKPILEKI